MELSLGPGLTEAPKPSLYPIYGSALLVPTSPRFSGQNIEKHLFRLCKSPPWKPFLFPKTIPNSSEEQVNAADDRFLCPDVESQSALWLHSSVGTQEGSMPFIQRV